MPMQPGSQFGPYDVLSLIGAGGMGEVYRAHDRTLGRDVALKLVTVQAPHARSAEEPLDRLAREARALAALNHPHIGVIYGLESQATDAGSTPVTALVLELVEGPTLADRIRRGPLPIAEALRLAAQIAGAVAAAHERHIVHRDLKPANIKVTPSGVVKVLDFGLAKSMALPEPAANASTEIATRQGSVVGTAPYMSPEQARGEELDTRTDAWAFGCVLYEMLTGHRAFAGATWSDCVAAVLEREPDWSQLPPAVPEEIRALLRRCLLKDRERRMRSLADAQLVLEDAATTPASVVALPTARRSPAPIAVAVLAVLGVMGGAAGWLFSRPDPGRPGPLMRVEIVPSADDAINVATTTPTLALSADGTQLAWAADRPQDRGSGGPLVVRDVGELLVRRVEGAPVVRDPFFSPDGKWVGYYSGGPGVYKVPVAGGTRTTILPNAGTLRGASWVADGTIVYASGDPATGLLRVSDSGGTPAILTRPNHEQGEAEHFLPSVLPDGRGVLFTILDQAGTTRVAVLDSRTQSQKVLIPGAVSAHYVDGGFLVYAAAGTVSAVGFDLNTLELRGEPVPLATGVLMGTAIGAYYAVSRTGTLAYVPASATPHAPRRLVWVDRAGVETPLGTPPRAYQSVRIAPDGNRLAVSIADEQQDVWTVDLRNPRMVRITTDAAADWSPIWTPDGQRLIYTRREATGSNVFRQAADGTGVAERLTSGIVTYTPTTITPDGTFLVGQTSFPTPWTLFRLPLGRSGQAEPLQASSAAIRYLSALSPNGRFIAYVSDEGGGTEVFVRTFPDLNGGRWQVTTGGGDQPRWAPNGRELFYLDSSRRLAGVTVDTSGAALQLGTAIALRTGSYYNNAPGVFDVSRDATKFLVIKEDPAARPPNTPIVMVLNAVESLPARATAR